jgi:hypothetical protein
MLPRTPNIHRHTHTHAPQDFPADKDREVRISGPPDCAEQAERMVSEIIASGDSKGTQQVIYSVLNAVSQLLQIHARVGEGVGVVLVLVLESGCTCCESSACKKDD